ncbi:hypothetical protein BsWGS_15169 [Bradybaena similaris]
MPKHACVRRYTGRPPKPLRADVYWSATQASARHFTVNKNSDPCRVATVIVPQVLMVDVIDVVVDVVVDVVDDFNVVAADFTSLNGAHFRLAPPRSSSPFIVCKFVQASPPGPFIVYKSLPKQGPPSPFIVYKSLCKRRPPDSFIVYKCLPKLSPPGSFIVFKSLHIWGPPGSSG